MYARLDHLISIPCLLFACACATDTGAVGIDPRDGGGGERSHSGGRSHEEGASGSSDDDQPQAAPCVDGCDDDLTQRPTPSERPFCPPTEVMEGAACSDPGRTCAYGDAVSGGCKRTLRCEVGAWRLAYRVGSWCHDEAAACPASQPESGADCIVVVPEGPSCAYDELTCFCVGQGPPGSRGIWRCYGPPRDTRCPAKLPNVGQGCGAESQGVECWYGPDTLYSCFPDANYVFCRNGEWELAGAPRCAS